MDPSPNLSKMRTIGTQFYHDKKRKRFVVYRRKMKTSVRYGAVRTMVQAKLVAWKLAVIWRAIKP